MKLLSWSFVFLIASLFVCFEFGFSEEKLENTKGPDIEKKFTQWDRNGDGKLTSDELKKPEMFQKMDTDKDGFVTLSEAKALMSRALIPFSERLKQQDTNGDGKLSREEFKRPEFFDRLDKNKDGFVTLEEGEEARKGKKIED